MPGWILPYPACFMNARAVRHLFTRVAFINQSQSFVGSNDDSQWRPDQSSASRMELLGFDGSYLRWRFGLPLCG